MINEIINGICLKLKELYPEGYNIYTDKVQDGFIKPYFSVSLVNGILTKQMQQRYFKNQLFGIEFHPSSNLTANEECNQVAEKLIFNLEYITINETDLIRGTNINYKISDGVLVFCINYNMFVKKEITPEEPMEGIQENTQIN